MRRHCQRVTDSTVNTADYDRRDTVAALAMQLPRSTEREMREMIACLTEYSSSKQNVLLAPSLDK